MALRSIAFLRTIHQAIIKNTQGFAQYSSRPLYSFFVPATVVEEPSFPSLGHAQFIFEEPLRVPLHYSRDQFDEVLSLSLSKVEWIISSLIEPSVWTLKRKEKTTNSVQVSVIDLLHKFKAKNVVYIYMAVLMGYRLLVMGHNISTSEICRYLSLPEL